VVVLLVLLAAELVLVLGLVVTLVVELLVATPESFASAVALTVIAALAAVWLAAILVGVVRGRAWTRGAALVWQVLQGAIGIGALQGAFAAPIWGWPLLAAGAIGVVLLLSRRVGDWLSDRTPPGP